MTVKKQKTSNPFLSQKTDYLKVRVGNEHASLTSSKLKWIGRETWEIGEKKMAILSLYGSCKEDALIHLQKVIIFLSSSFIHH